ncbi:hypothetical protein G6F40_015954 [Rhizopus arrhizus]|nr:hypothetical protein G6F40_015954 [Rhizopus arrhizus]
MPIAELRQRPAAQAHHQDAAGLGVEQHEAHHHPRVLQLQRIGIEHGHAALDFLLREMQRAAGAVVLDEWPVDGRRRVWVLGVGGMRSSGHGQGG